MFLIKLFLYFYLIYYIIFFSVFNYILNKNIFFNKIKKLFINSIIRPLIICFFLIWFVFFVNFINFGFGLNFFKFCFFACFLLWIIRIIRLKKNKFFIIKKNTKKSFFNIFIELISINSRIISLNIRLFINIFVGFISLSFLSQVYYFNVFWFLIFLCLFFYEFIILTLQRFILIFLIELYILD